MINKRHALLIEETTLEELLALLDSKTSKRDLEFEALKELLIQCISRADDSPSNTGKLLTDKDLVEITGLTRQTLRKYREDGRLRNIKSVEPRIRYSREDVDEFLRGRYEK